MHNQRWTMNKISYYRHPHTASWPWSESLPPRPCRSSNRRCWSPAHPAPSPSFGLAPCWRCPGYCATTLLRCSAGNSLRIDFGQTPYRVSPLASFTPTRSSCSGYRRLSSLRRSIPRSSCLRPCRTRSPCSCWNWGFLPGSTGCRASRCPRGTWARWPACGGLMRTSQSGFSWSSCWPWGWGDCRPCC